MGRLPGWVGDWGSAKGELAPGPYHQPSATNPPPQTKRIGAAHNRSAAAVALRWVVQQGVPVVTSSDKAEYDEEDLAVFDFNLTAAEMERLAAVAGAH